MPIEKFIQIVKQTNYNVKQKMNFQDINLKHLAVAVLCTRSNTLDPGLDRCNSGVDSRKAGVGTSNAP